MLTIRLSICNFTHTVSLLIISRCGVTYSLTYISLIANVFVLFIKDLFLWCSIRRLVGVYHEFQSSTSLFKPNWFVSMKLTCSTDMAYSQFLSTFPRWFPGQSMKYLTFPGSTTSRQPQVASSQVIQIFKFHFRTTIRSKHMALGTVSSVLHRFYWLSVTLYSWQIPLWLGLYGILLAICLLYPL